MCQYVFRECLFLFTPCYMFELLGLPLCGLTINVFGIYRVTDTMLDICCYLHGSMLAISSEKKNDPSVYMYIYIYI